MYVYPYNHTHTHINQTIPTPTFLQKQVLHPRTPAPTFNTPPSKIKGVQDLLTLPPLPKSTNTKSHLSHQYAVHLASRTRLPSRPPPHSGTVVLTA